MKLPLIARCGTLCSECTYKEKMNCPTCHKACGKMFWGTCQVAQCSIDKGIENCSECDDFPCELLKSYSYDKEQGDNGKRIETLRKVKKEREKKSSNIS